MSALSLTPKGRATRARLLAAAGKQLAARGRVELATVAEDAGVAPSVVYRYFGSKDGLVAAVVESFYAEYQANVFAIGIFPGASWIERERERLQREVIFVYEHPLGRVVVAGLLRERAATQADALHLRHHIAMAARNIRAGQRAHELPAEVDAELAAAAIMGALRSLMAEALRRADPPPPRVVASLALVVGHAALMLP